MRIIIRVLVVSGLIATQYSCSSKKNKDAAVSRIRMHLYGLGFIKGPFKKIKESGNWNDSSVFTTTTYTLDTASRVLIITDPDGRKSRVFLNNDYRTDSVVTETGNSRITSFFWHSPFYDDKVMYQKEGNGKTDTTFFAIDSSDRSRASITITHTNDPGRRTINYYDKEGFFVETRTIKSDSTVNTTWHFKYDKNGDIIWQRLDGNEDGFEAITKFTNYDEYGNWTRMQQEFRSFSKEKKYLVTVTRKITY